MTRVFVEDVKKEAYKWCNCISGTFNSTRIWVKEKVKKNFDLFSPSLASPLSVSIQVKKQIEMFFRMFSFDFLPSSHFPSNQSLLQKTSCSFHKTLRSNLPCSRIFFHTYSSLNKPYSHLYVPVLHVCIFICRVYTVLI